MKQLEIEKTKPTLSISVLKVDIIKVGLVFSISNFFITKTSLANKWRRKRIPSCSNSALTKMFCVHCAGGCVQKPTRDNHRTLNQVRIKQVKQKKIPSLYLAH